MRIFILFFILLFSCFCDAQKMYLMGDEMSWSAMRGYRSLVYESQQYNFSHLFTYLNNDAVIISAYDNEKESSSLIKVNNQGKVIWKTTSKSSMGSAKFIDKLITFYTTETEEDKKIAIVMGVIIDPINGKLISQKEIYRYQKKEYSREKLVKDPQNNFQFLSIEHGKTSDSKTEQLTLIWLDNKLGVSNQKEFSFVNKEKKLIGISGNEKGECYMAVCSDNGILSIDRISKKGETLNSLTLPMNIEFNNVKTVLLKPDETNGTKLLASWLAREKEDKVYINVLAEYDFTANTVKMNKQIFDKEAEKMLKEKAGENKKTIRDFLFFKTGSIISTPDKIITIAEFKDTNEKNFFFNYAILVTVYDKELKNEQWYVIPRSMTQDYYLALSTAGHVKNNKLYIPFADRASVKKFNSYLCTIDLGTGKQDITKIEVEDNHKSACVEPDATLWFDNYFYLTYLNDKRFTNNQTHTSFQKVDY